MYDDVALDKDLAVLESQGAKVFTIGYTVLGRPIKCVVKGNLSGPCVFVQASMHAREYITTPLVIEMMKNYNGSVGVWCVPMVNVDGVLLCQLGLDSVPDPSLREFLLNVNGGSRDFSLWKANARAVDLNVNYNARWGEGRQNVTYPAPSDYIGKFPVSEPENIALRDFTNKLQPSVTLSYHTKGEVIYWGFECIKPYFEYAQRISNVTGYPIFESADSAGGYKDWYTATTFKLGLTLEVVNGEVPYPIDLGVLPEVYKQNAAVLETAAVIAEEIERIE